MQIRIKFIVQGRPWWNDATKQLLFAGTSLMPPNLTQPPTLLGAVKNLLSTLGLVVSALH